MNTAETVIFFVGLFGGVALIIGSSLVAVRRPRKRGEPLSGERKAWMVVPVLGAILIIAAVLSL
jgi:nitrate reductase gamma subunit